MQVDLKDIIRQKNPKLYRKLPNFVIWMFRRLVHERDVNHILAQFSNLPSVEFTTAMLDELKIKREAIGLDDLAEDRKYIFASNHPLGGLDGLALVEVIDNRWKGAAVLANDILMNLSPLRDIFLPINKHGRQTVEYAKLVNSHLESGKPLIYFPAGLCSRKIKGEITDLVWKRNFILKAIEYKRDIVPVYVAERNSQLFYNVGLLRSKLNIKANLEMLLLPRELFRKSKKKGGVKMIFGTPISYKELSTTHSQEYWSEVIRKRCYELKSKQ